MSGAAAVRGLAALGAAVIVGLAGCGSPAFHYVKNSDEQLYFKVPSSWHKVDPTQLENEVSSTDPDSASRKVERELRWLVAYDASDKPDAGHIFAPTSDEPIVYANVQILPEAVRGGVSYDVLRDMILPVTDSARESATQAGVPLEGFELLRDEVLTPGKVHGVRVTYNYKILGGPLQTFDLTAYTTDDASRIYMLLVRCSAKCYQERSGELDDIVESFTVKGAK
jgi:hypothetical protein